VPPVRWGIVGASDIADRVMAPAMVEAPGAELVAIASRSPERGAWFARRQLRRASRADPGSVPQGGVRTYSSAAELASDPDVDAVYVATEVDRHAADVAAVAAAGKDVLVEKPIARTAAEGEAMVDLCAKAGVRLGTCFYQRYNARHLRIRELLAAGAIGRPATVTMNFSGRSPARDGSWRRDPLRSGGGSFIDSASHCVDLLRFLFGETQQLSAFIATVAESYQVEDTAIAILRQVSGVHAVVAAHWSVTDPSDARSSVISIGGTEGSIVSWPLHDKFSRGTLLLATEIGEREIDTPEASTHAALLDDFAAARAAGRPFPISGEDGVAAQRIVDGVYRASRTGQMVVLA
jgi:1,5-anhydro-D-fructose reductase (1,5-anhydro-D-mannitol-forming)